MGMCVIHNYAEIVYNYVFGKLMGYSRINQDDVCNTEITEIQLDIIQPEILNSIELFDPYDLSKIIIN